MPDEKLLATTLAEFARTLAQRYAISDVLYDLARQVVVVLGVDSAGVSVEDGGRLRFVTALDERSTRLEELQERHQAGPCVDAWQTGEIVTVNDLRAATHDWGTYLEAAHDAGVLAVAGIPMKVNDKSIGALDLYSDTARDWSSEDLDAACVLADMATSYVVHASELEQQRRTNEQLQEALDSRIVIEQAKGILAAERSITVDDAFELLRLHARSHNANLRAVAEAVVDLGLRPRVD